MRYARWLHASAAPWRRQDQPPPGARLSLCSTRAAAGLGLSVLDGTRASDRVFLLDGHGRQCSYPVCWTDAVEPDVSVSFAAVVHSGWMTRSRWPGERRPNRPGTDQMQGQLPRECKGHYAVPCGRVWLDAGRENTHAVPNPMPALVWPAGARALRIPVSFNVRSASRRRSRIVMITRAAPPNSTRQASCGPRSGSRTTMLGITTFHVIHDQNEAMALADRIAILDEGRLQQIGTPHEVYRDPANAFVAGFVGLPPMTFLTVTVDGDMAILSFGLGSTEP